MFTMDRTVMFWPAVSAQAVVDLCVIIIIIIIIIIMFYFRA